MSEPRINATIESQRQVITEEPQRALILNEAVGDFGDQAVFRDILNDSSWESLFDPRSLLSQDIRAFKKVNSFTPLDVVAIKSSVSATPALASITFAGTSIGEPSEFTYSIASRITGSFSITIIAGLTHNEIATAVANQIDQDPKLPVQALAVLGVVNLTAQLGLQGNNFSIEVSGGLPGVTVVISPFAGGNEVPPLLGAFDGLEATRYQTVIAPAEWNVSFLPTFLDPRFSVDNDIMDGVGVITLTGSLSTIKAAADTVNSRSLIICANDTVDLVDSNGLQSGGSYFEQNSVISSIEGAIRALRNSDGSDIASITTTTQPLDRTGGPAIAGLPYANSILNDIVPIGNTEKWAPDDELILNTAGAFILTNNRSDTKVVMNRVVTTYKTDSLGVKDPTFKFLNAVDISSRVRESMFYALKNTYSQARLTLGPVMPQRSMVNIFSLRAFIVGVYQTLGGPAFVLVDASDTGIAHFKKHLVIEIENYAEGKILISMRIIPVSQLRTIDMPISVSFTLEG